MTGLDRKWSAERGAALTQMRKERARLEAQLRDLMAERGQLLEAKEGVLQAEMEARDLYRREQQKVRDVMAERDGYKDALEQIAQDADTQAGQIARAALSGTKETGERKTATYPDPGNDPYPWMRGGYRSDT